MRPASADAGLLVSGAPALASCFLAGPPKACREHSERNPFGLSQVIVWGCYIPLGWHFSIFRLTKHQAGSGGGEMILFHGLM